MLFISIFVSYYFIPITFSKLRNRLILLCKHNYNYLTKRYIAINMDLKEYSNRIINIKQSEIKRFFLINDNE